MRTIYYLSTCSTCKRILSELAPLTDWALVDIKMDPIDESTLKIMYHKAGSYEALFNKRAQKLKTPEFKDRVLSENDYKELILSHYSFLKRPVFVFDEELLAGNSKQVVEAVKNHL